MDFFALTVGIIIHDLSKGSIRKMEEKYSHSQMMLKKPEYITKETEKVLKEIEEKVGAELKENIKKNIIHIVLSHHGKWGKIQPNSKEAHIVHRAECIQLSIIELTLLVQIRYWILWLKESN